MGIYQAKPNTFDLDQKVARGHWLTPRHIVWRAAGEAAEGCSFWLHSSQTAKLAARAGYLVNGIDSSVELSLVSSDLPEDLAAAHPYLKGCAVLAVPPEYPLQELKALCKTQLALEIRGSRGEAVDSTGVQIGAVLDELFPYAGPLGTSPHPIGGLELSLWAPTAQKVTVSFFKEPRGGEPEVSELSFQEESGIWHSFLPASSWGWYYTYEVTAFHPVTGKIEKMVTPDPYSKACSADGLRTLAVNLEAATEAVPDGDRKAWLSDPRPALQHRADAVVYELHVRDFSASDETVPAALRGKYLAFAEEGTAGDEHLQRLARAGVTHVQLLPTYDFGSVPEREEDRVEPKMPLSFQPDSEQPQAAIAAVADKDSYNWGYDPVLFDVPEGSYASEPDGLTRVLEHRKMVQALHAKGLRVVVDVVFNHTLGSGPIGNHSVLDKCVPGYYHRRAEDGRYENSTCCNNTAAERRMMCRRVVDSLLHWVKEYQVDGFRFDLMGHLPLACLQQCRAALDALTVEPDGIDGKQVLLYGEGWEFGEIENGQRGKMAVQQQLAGTGIGAFNDRIRDAAIGGSPFCDPREQGFSTGLVLRAWPEGEGPHRGSEEDEARKLLAAQDRLRLCLAGSLRSFVLEQDFEGNVNLEGHQVQRGGLAFAGNPVEVINYVSAHDNETLYDNTVWKMSPVLFSPEERMRANWLCTALVALGHGMPFFHAGDEVLRSKSLDRDSYNSGDWFNLLDLTGEKSAFGTGLPSKAKNGEKWDLMRPLLKDERLKPTKVLVEATTAKFCELIQLRRSTPLIGLHEAGDILEKVSFPGCGPSQLQGVLVMQTCNGPPAASSLFGYSWKEPLCSRFARVVIVFSSRFEETKIPVPPPGSKLCGQKPLRLHPLQQKSEDWMTRLAHFDPSSNELVVPPQAVAVFVEPMS